LSESLNADESPTKNFTDKLIDELFYIWNNLFLCLWFAIPRHYDKNTSRGIFQKHSIGMGATLAESGVKGFADQNRTGDVEPFGKLSAMALN
jgi:hypothetical protein